MKFPEGGIFLREVVWLRSLEVRVDHRNPKRKAGFEEKAGRALRKFQWRSLSFLVTVW
jgi:hypothetical protein